MSLKKDGVFGDKLIFDGKLDLGRNTKVIDAGERSRLEVDLSKLTLDESVRPVEYDYRTKAEMIAAKVPNPTKGEEHGLSVFFRVDNDVFHTYSTYARGTEALTDAYALLDRTPYGRQEDFEVSPPGWPQKPTYG